MENYTVSTCVGYLARSLTNTAIEVDDCRERTVADLSSFNFRFSMDQGVAHTCPRVLLPCFREILLIRALNDLTCPPHLSAHFCYLGFLSASGSQHNSRTKGRYRTCCSSKTSKWLPGISSISTPPSMIVFQHSIASVRTLWLLNQLYSTPHNASVSRVSRLRSITVLMCLPITRGEYAPRSAALVLNSVSRWGLISLSLSWSFMLFFELILFSTYSMTLSGRGW